MKKAGCLKAEPVPLPERRYLIKPAIKHSHKKRKNTCPTAAAQFKRCTSAIFYKSGVLGINVLF
jgi:hypothetical protein